MDRKNTSGLSGIVAALMVAAILITGIVATNYVSTTSSAQNRQMLDELRRQAFRDQELIRIYIHAQNSSDLDSPPRITIVNAWGWPSNITKLLAVYRQGEGRQIVEINRQIVVPPGSKVTIDPGTLGINYSMFRQLADNLTALIAYTDVGNSFGNTWGYPREDNLLGATTSTTYYTTTTDVWTVPSFTTVNNTIIVSRTITLNPPPPIEEATIQAVNHFERITVRVPAVTTGSGSTEILEPGPLEGSPSAPIPSDTRKWNFRLIGHGPIDIAETGYRVQGWSYILYAWEPTGWFVSIGSVKTAIKNTYFTVVNAPMRVVYTISLDTDVECTAMYSLRRVEISPSPPGYPAPTATKVRQGMFVSMTHYATTTGPYRWHGLPAGPGLTFNQYNTLTATLLYNGNPFVWNGKTVAMSGWVTAGRATLYGSNGWSAWQAQVSALTYTAGPENLVKAYYLLLTEDSYTVHRYYYVDKVECNIYTPAPPRPHGTYAGGGGGGEDVPPRCNVYGVAETSSSSSGGGSGGSSGGGSSGGSVGVIRIRYVVNCSR